MKHILTRLLVISSLLVSFSVQAQLSLNKIIVNFASDSAPTDDVLLQNSSSVEPLFVKVEVLEVLNPGTKSEQRNVVDDPSKIGLVATPAKLILPPNAQKTVRLINLQDNGKKDRIYRINFTPVVGDQNAKQTGVKLMIGYQALIIVRPSNMNAKLDSKRDGKVLSLHNTGNTNIFVESLRQCKTNRLEECTSIPERRVYAGNNIKIDLPGTGPVVFDIFDGETRKRVQL